MKTKYKCIPFDIELCKKIINKKIKGHIVTLDGRKVRVICTDKKDKPGLIEPYCIIALVTEQDGYESVYHYLSNGKIHVLSETDLDLQIEIPTYQKDYSNFIPQKWQSCVVRNFSYDTWEVRVCCGKNSHGEPNFFTTSSCDSYCYQNYILPLNNVTKRLIGLTKSYEQLIEELDKK